MSARLALAVAFAAAGTFVAGPPAYAEEVCQSVRVDLINDWVYCVRVTQNPDGSVTAGFECDMAQNPCQDVSVTLP